MSSFGSSAINKSTRKLAPKVARRRPGTGPDDRSQPATPALSATSVRSSVEPPLAQLTYDESQYLAEESLITHAANETSQAARDAIETQLQHQAQGLASGVAQHTSRYAAGARETGKSGAGRSDRSGLTPTDAALASPLSPEAFARLREANLHARAAASAGGETQFDPSAASGKRKRAGSFVSAADQRTRHLQTSGEFTSASTEIEDQVLDDGLDETEHVKKPRKVRKDKGVPRRKKPETRPSDAPVIPSTEVQLPPPPTRELRKRPTRAPQPITEQAVPDVAIDAAAEEEGEEQTRKRKKRKATPEGNEEIEIDPRQTQMADMLYPSKIGKVSDLEKRMRQVDWAEVKRRRAAARRPPDEQEPSEQVEGSGSAPDSKGQHVADVDGVNIEEEDDEEDRRPSRRRTRIVNGVVTVVDEAMHVDRHAEADREIENLEVVEEDDITTRITSHSWLDANRRDENERRYGRKKSDPWGGIETEKFYEALRMFGTDFFVIAKMFKGKTRRNIKMKFVREEHDDPERIKRALHSERKPMDIEAFKLATGIQSFKSASQIQQELEDDMRTREEEIVRAKEEYVELERQRRVMEGEGGEGGTGESAKENEAPGGTKSKKKGKAASGRKEKDIATTIETNDDDRTEVRRRR